RGRSFDTQDSPDSTPAVLINQRLAEKYWPGQDAIGKRLKVGPVDSQNAWLTVVGVVGEVRQTGLYEQKLEFYVPYMQERRSFMAPRDLVIRTKADSAVIAAGVRQAVWKVDKDQPVSN